MRNASRTSWTCEAFLFNGQLIVPVTYKGLQLSSGYRLDLLIEETLVVEIKSADALLPVHGAQLVTYLKLGGWPLGLLINFNVSMLKQGIQRRVHNLKE